MRFYDIFKSTCMISSLFLATAACAAEPPKQNVLMIIVDDLNDWVGALGGHPNALTPNIDQLAAEGMLFTNAHATAAICAPSRASVMTGLRPSTTGIYGQMNDRNIKKVNEIAGKATYLSKYFANNGYKTMAIGKIFHNGAPKGSFDEYAGRAKGFGPYPDKPLKWPKRPGTGTDWGVFPERDEQMPDYKSAMWAKDKLSEKHDKPFFMAVGFLRPHVPWLVPQKWFDRHPLDGIAMPPYLKNDDDDTSEISKEIHKMPMMPTTEWAIENGEWKNIVQAYLASVSFADHYVGEVLKALKNSPYADNTIVVLWSDHGYHIGEKNRFAKHSLWEETSHVPLIIKSPSTIKGQTTNTPVSLLDLYPTLLELADLPRNEQNEGTSLAPLLTGEGDYQEHVAISAYGWGNHAVRDERYRYIHFADGSEELYDHQNDPDEWVNLADDPKMAAVIKRLKAEIPANPEPFTKYSSGRPTNDYFRQLYKNAGIPPRKN